MNSSIDEILDECLAQMEAGQATLEEFLTSHPEHAESLRPLVQTALQVRGLEQPIATEEGFEEGKELMLSALAWKKRERAKAAAAPSPWPMRVAVGVLAAATVLVWVAASGLLARVWYMSVAAQQAVVADASGVVQVRTAQDAAWQPLATGWVLKAGHSIRTGDPSRATVSYFDGSTTVLGVDTEVTIAQMSARRSGEDTVIVLQQSVGHTHNTVQTADGSWFEVQTGGAVAVAHGTEFGVYVEEDGSTRVVVIDGAVSVTASGATVVLAAGEATSVQPGGAPSPVVMAPPAELSEPGVPAGTETPEETSTVEPAPTGVATDTAVPAGESPAADTPIPSVSPTATRAAGPDGATATPTSGAVVVPSPTPTVTSRPVQTPTATPRPTDIPTATSEPTATATVAPSPTPSEVVEIIQADYRQNQRELRVKARSSVVECSLTLQGFGPMIVEGDHWTYIVEDMDPEDVPATVTVLSSCGGSATRAVE